MNKKQIIERNLSGMLDKSKAYHSALSPTLQDWYCYTLDGGHSILCVLAKDYKSDADLSDYLLPVPVRSVLRGFEIKDEYVVVDLPYSSETGLESIFDDEEF